MSIRYMFSNEEDVPFRKEPKVAGCWAFLKLFKSTFDTIKDNFNEFLACQDPFRKELYPASFHDDTVGHCGIPIVAEDEVRYLRVYSPYDLYNRKSAYSLKWVYDNVMVKLPQWFQDFEYCAANSSANGEYYRVDCNGSFLRNYNALRFARSLYENSRRIQEESLLDEMSPSALLVYLECYHPDGEAKYVDDSCCIPYSLFNTLDEIITRVEKGPLFNIDTPLLGETRVERKVFEKRYGSNLYPITRAFVNPQNLSSLGDESLVSEGSPIPFDVEDFKYLCNGVQQ